jgi:hypothetical protein
LEGGDIRKMAVWTVFSDGINGILSVTTAIDSAQGYFRGSAE